MRAPPPPIVVLLSAVGLPGICSLALLVPAWRAAAVDPVRDLRGE